MSTGKAIKKWWNNASSYYQEVFMIPTNDIYYGPYCPTEKELKIINISKIKNKKVLEVGCGGGQASVFLAKNKANCCGIDISKKQIEYAKKLAQKNNVNIDYHIGTAENLKFFKKEEFDIVLSIFSLQYINNMDKCFREIKRVLKKGGKIIFSLDHPFYSVISPETMKICSDYNYSAVNRKIRTSDIIEKKEWGEGNKSEFIFYFRKISDISNSLINAGLNIQKIIEPAFSDTKGPWDKIYSKKVAKHLSPTIIFIAKKE